MTPKVSGAAPAVALVGLTLIETYGLFRLVPRVTAGEQLTTQETAGLVISGMPVLCAILGLIHNRRLSRATPELCRVPYEESARTWSRNEGASLHPASYIPAREGMRPPIHR